MKSVVRLVILACVSLSGVALVSLGGLGCSSQSGSDEDQGVTSGSLSAGDQSQIVNGPNGNSDPLDPRDPGAPRMAGGPGHEPDPSPWKNTTAELGPPNEPDPSPWRLESSKISAPAK